ncbi:cellulase family glycosylhydrolase (plasmid) [Mycobacterium sp. smrl_JER01]|uniref:cellulase family glycosylhydrolase n=1 Tax=Mycobacterium sp. smrl_JER01 TaxID=3402633 RepID=UPI003AC44746
MTTSTPLLRAKIAAGTVAAVTLASVLTTAPATATTVEQTRPVQQVAISLLSETSTATTAFGVADSHLYNLDPDDLAARLTELRGLGVSDLRIAVPWVYIEPAAGTYDWSKMDALVSTAREMGFTLTGAVTATPTWAGFPLAGAPNPDTYAGFAGAVAARYGSQIASYEVWNEPNGVIFYAPVSAAGYTQMLKAAYTAIKAANPDAVVLAGSLGATTDVSGISVTPQRFLAQMYEAGAGGYFDALSYHPYHFTLPFSQGAGTLNTPLEQVKALYELMVANGDADKKIWATEYGTATTPGWGVTQAEQAALLRDFLTAWSRLPYTGPAFVYTAQDTQSGILNHEFNFGLFTSNGKPKLAAHVLADLIAQAGLGELPDYTAPRMSAARDLYLQLASVGFGLANQAMVIPNAAIAVIYSLMPAPLRRAFTAVANAVSAVVAQVAVAATPVMEAMLGVVIRALPPTSPTTADDEQSEQPTDLSKQSATETGAAAVEGDLPAGPVRAIEGIDADASGPADIVTTESTDSDERPSVETAEPGVIDSIDQTDTETATRVTDQADQDASTDEDGAHRPGIAAEAPPTDSAAELGRDGADGRSEEARDSDPTEDAARRTPRTATSATLDRLTRDARDHADRRTGDSRGLSPRTAAPSSNKESGDAS